MNDTLPDRPTTDHAPAGSKSRQAYFQEGGALARALPNRGPVRFEANGELAGDIREAYEAYGFYVFEGVLGPRELDELDADLAELLDRAPVCQGADVDAQGRPALGAGRKAPLYSWARPLSDPWGGTRFANGRHAVRMEEPAPGADAPEKTINLLTNVFDVMDSALRLAAHPLMLRVAEAINGPDFVPYNDTIFVKEPGLGASTAWHQDGTTHWENPAWHPGIHGFNFMAQLCRTTPANALWMVPGSHRAGRVDIKALVAANGGSDRLPDAVPMLCERGDVAISNRQCLHASFANVSPDRRVTFVWGFFPHDAVLDVEAAALDGTPRRYTAEWIHRQSSLVQLGIDARRAHRPDETPYRYAPFVGQEDQHRWSPAVRDTVLRDYSQGMIFV